MADGKEIEIKLVWQSDRAMIDPWASKALRRLLATDVPQGSVLQYSAHYYDTVDHSLLKQGIAFRVRQEGEEWVATLKRDEGSIGGFFRRQEWNEKVTGPEPRPDLFPDISVTADTLKPFMTTRFERTQWILHLSGDSVVELVIDRGEIAAGEKTSTIREVELELKRGDLSELLRVAALLSRHCGLVIESRSKYERGLELASIKPASINEKPKPKEDTCAGYFQHLLAEAQRKQTCFLADPKQEKRLRMLRIQLRRLRSMVSFWGGYLREKEAELPTKQLRNWFREMGEVRSIDVMLTLLGQESGEEFALRRLRLRRKNLRRLLVSHLWEGELTGLLFELWGRILSQRVPKNCSSLSEDGYCRTRLLSWCKSIKKDLRLLPQLSENESKLHKLRIRIKRLRYVLEDMSSSPFYDRTFIEHLRIVQDVLGRIQDAGETKRLLRDLGAGGEYVLVRLDADQQLALQELPVVAEELRESLVAYTRKPLFLG